MHGIIHPNIPISVFAPINLGFAKQSELLYIRPCFMGCLHFLTPRVIPLHMNLPGELGLLAFRNR